MERYRQLLPYFVAAVTGVVSGIYVFEPMLKEAVAGPVASPKNDKSTGIPLEPKETRPDHVPSSSRNG